MIEETVQVVAIHGELAEVQTQRRAACGSCEAKAGCGSSLLASVFGNRRTRITVLNPIQARPGDRVVIGLQEGSFLRAAFALYAVPLLAMLGGAVFGEWLALRSAAENTELAGLWSGLLGLILGLGWVWRFSRRTGRDARYRAVVLRKASTPALRVGLP
jgi:sigma-E factor negative regulatory protein RseC